MDHAEVRAELDRVGVTYGKAGAADYVQDRDEGAGRIALLGPPPPRLIWRGPAFEALRRLNGLENDAGVTAFWDAFRPGDLVCAECGCSSSGYAEGWQSQLGYDPREDEWPEASVFCPDCSAREFGD